jgi:TRAP-type mannitol/chloroaromatic compound transport system permease small subunit
VNDIKMQPQVPIADAIDNFVKKVSHGIAWVYVLLILVIITQVFLRKGFASGQIWLEELEWHLYAIGVMFGLAYAQINNAHVRVDLFYSNFSRNTKHIIDIIGVLFFVLPFIYIIFIHSLDFVADAWRTGEASESPSGLPFRWLIKSAIPASMVFFALSSMSRLIRDTTLLLRGDK